MEQALELFEPHRRPAELDREGGYLDLLGAAKAGGNAAQRLMRSRAVPLVYQRFWRPVAGRLLMGLTGPGTEEEHRIALAMLAISPGDRVLDVACGPGNFTLDFALAAGNGPVVGIDSSQTMLGVAVRENPMGNLAYVRGDARDLPFRDRSFDAVCCFAALYLIEEPMQALAEMVRVLAPGGRLALMSSCNRGPVPTSVANAVVRGLSGVRVFGHEELTRALEARGAIDLEQRVSGLAQFVSARKPARP
ncbi:MAG TPA: methyltransferase domain-containing protein [Solirubrobacterales bacterium]|jgi:SAM-dependent methyltransferase|nr:methyltransferase domain-containing protein [Solirubrobacterales bacterium]